MSMPWMRKDKSPVNHKRKDRIKGMKHGTIKGVTFHKVAELQSLEERRVADRRKTEEQVNHPSHYGGKDNPHEHYKCMLGSGLIFNGFLYNATKYIWRAGKKGLAIQDLEKAIWYLQKEIERLKEK